MSEYIDRLIILVEAPTKEGAICSLAIKCRRASDGLIENMFSKDSISVGRGDRIVLSFGEGSAKNDPEVIEEDRAK